MVGKHVNDTWALTTQLFGKHIFVAMTPMQQ
jgi:hypothetical protein